ncbi:hypothetical protein EMIHUDRAFT_225698, partial [Emiliania huxleyi CCMP1516]
MSATQSQQAPGGPSNARRKLIIVAAFAASVSASPPSPPSAPACNFVADVVLVLDSSGSIDESSSRPGVAKFATDIINDLAVDENFVHVGIVEFASNTYVCSNLTYDDNTLASAINDTYKANIKPDPGDRAAKTFISNALLLGEQLLTRTGRTEATKIMLLLTDGEQTCSRNYPDTGDSCPADGESYIENCYVDWDFGNSTHTPSGSPLGPYIGDLPRMCGSEAENTNNYQYRKPEAIWQAELIKNRNPELVLFAVGFGAVSHETLGNIATPGYSFKGTDIQAVTAEFQKNSYFS